METALRSGPSDLTECDSKMSQDAILICVQVVASLVIALAVCVALAIIVYNSRISNMTMIPRKQKRTMRHSRGRQRLHPPSYDPIERFG